MSKDSVPFHVQHIARPEHIEHILGIATDYQSLDADVVRRRLAQEGHSITKDATRRSLDWASKLGLFEKEALTDKPSRLTYTLTARGQACRNLALYRREVYCDVMHFLLFAIWELGGQLDYWSWSYAKVCEIMWSDRPRIERRRAIFGQLSAEAKRSFPALDPVVGTETVGAVVNWLKGLSPPFLVLDNEKVLATQEREWFSVELALLAILYLYAASGFAVKTPILLDSPTIEQLCPLCLAPTGSIMTMIEVAARTFSFLEIHTGEWGSSVILQQDVDVGMLT